MILATKGICWYILLQFASKIASFIHFLLICFHWPRSIIWNRCCISSRNNKVPSPTPSIPPVFAASIANCKHDQPSIFCLRVPYISYLFFIPISMMCEAANLPNCLLSIFYQFKGSTHQWKNQCMKIYGSTEESVH